MFLIKTSNGLSILCVCVCVREREREREIEREREREREKERPVTDKKEAPAFWEHISTRE